MKRKKIFWLIFPPFIILILSVVIVLIWWSMQSFRDFHIKQKREELRTIVSLLKNEIIFRDLKLVEKSCIEFCLNASKVTGSRITIIEPGGQVLGDSHEDLTRLGNHNDRPEFQQSMQGNVGVSIRYSVTLSSSLMYVATKVDLRNGEVLVLRISKPISEIYDQLEVLYLNKIWVIAIVLLCIIYLIFVISRGISSPIENIIKDINSMPLDHWKGLQTNAKAHEVQTLVSSLNKMGLELNNKLKLIEKDSNEQEIIFSNMRDGIIAIDSSHRIIKINDSAISIFSLNVEDIKVKKIEELIRYRGFLSLLENLKTDEGNKIIDLEISGSGNNILQIKANRIVDKRNKFFGCLFVIADITQVRRLESMRRDFVSNVSHELKTPLTSIKGYIETLLYSKDLKPDISENFLTKINNNSNRLQTIIEDLLMLSRVEQDGLSDLELENFRVIEVINQVVDECQQKNFNVETLNIRCDKNISIKAHRSLLAQALFNLLDNAFKYSDQDPKISIMVEEKTNFIEISISDKGPGIDEKHIPHLLERFYRVDKARSREKGGSGLGLSIVKHIVQAHHGDVEISSLIGKGSDFLVKIPKN